MKILILTLTGQRDTVIDESIARYLRIFGHEVVVRNYINAGREAVIYDRPDVLIHPMVGGRWKLDFVKQCKQWGLYVIVRRGEAGASREQFAKMDSERQTIILGNWNYEPYVDLELTWGKEFTDLLVEKGCITNDKTYPCGAFAFDPYFTIQRERKHRKRILFATAWSTADCRVEFCECGLPEDSPYHNVVYKAHRQGRDLWIDSIRYLHDRLGHEWEFALKVRPGEQTREYHEKLGDIVHVYPQTYPAPEAIRVSDIVVHAGSTMAIEAHLLGIPTINFHNVNPDRLLAVICPNVDTVEALQYEIERTDINQSNIRQHILKELETHLYGPIEGKACQKAAERIEHFLKGKRSQANIPDQWPVQPLYHEDQQVHLRRYRNDRRWFCPACKNIFWVNMKIELAKCPYCGMTIALTGEKKMAPVLK